MGRVGDCDEPIWLLHAEQGAAAKGYADAVGRLREPGPATALASTPKYGARSCFLTSGRDSASPGDRLRAVAVDSGRPCQSLRFQAPTLGAESRESDADEMV